MNTCERDHSDAKMSATGSKKRSNLVVISSQSGLNRQVLNQDPPQEPGFAKTPRKTHILRSATGYPFALNGTRNCPKATPGSPKWVAEGVRLAPQDTEQGS